MIAGPSLTAAGESLLGRDLLIPLGGLSGAAALLGMLLLLPIFVGQRREIGRLRAWMDRDPDAGTREFRAITAAEAAAGRSSAADRVTSERPALERVGTSEHRALELERAPWWRRVVERGPRHPLVVSLAAIAVAAGIFFAASQFIRAGSGDGEGTPVDPSSVSVVVVNASSSAGLAGDVSDRLEAELFAVSGTSVARKGVKESVVQYAAPENRREARAVAKALGIQTVEPFDEEAQAAAAGADVVVLAGDDAAKAKGGKG